MKHKVWIHHVGSALFAFVLAVCSVGNLITGHDLPVEAMWKICLWSALAAAAVAVAFKFPQGGKILLGLGAMLIFGLCLAELFRPNLQKQTQTLLHCISSHYHDVYNWPLWGKQSASDVSMPLILWAVLVTVCVNWCICRGKHIAVAILPTVMPLILCLLTEDKVPGAKYMYWMILAIAVLLITDWTRKKQPAKSMKLALWFVLPTALFLALLFARNPQADYVSRAGQMQKDLTVWFEKAQDAVVSVMTGTPVDGSSGRKRNLQTVGEKNKSSRSVMLVNSPIDGMLYLRERDYDVYTGVTWEASVDRKEQFTRGATATGKLEILTYSVRSTLLVPYYASGGALLTGGAVANDRNLQEYSYGVAQTISHKTPAPDEGYTQLPEEVQAWATELVGQITEGITSNRAKVARIEEYVRNCAAYAAEVDRMDSSYDDFARWFIEQSDEGYCVHYATAATVLLRAAGIPARYVEGYAVNCKAGKDTLVSKQEAHAWVEYYDAYAYAWCIMEATPAFETVVRPKFVYNTKEETGSEKVEIPIEVAPGEDPTDEPPQEEEEPTEAPAETLPEDPVIIPDEPGIQDGPGQDKDPQDPVAEPQGMPEWIKFVFVGILIAAGLLLQGYVRIAWKRKMWNRGAPNDCTIWRWRQTRSVAKRLKQAYPEALDSLAQKARFSQHEIQQAELQQYEDYRVMVIALIAQKPWYQKMLFKWIYAIDK